MKKNHIKLSIALIIGVMSNSVLAEKITVFAAASMTNVLQQIGDEYERLFPQDQLVFSFAGSSTLSKQIEQDAPADIFISADQKWVDYLATHQANKIKTQAILTENTLVLIVPKKSVLLPKAVSEIDFNQAIGDSYLAIGDDNVPVGRYAKKALLHLNKWGEVENRLAKAKDVRSVLAYIIRGELPLGIVYSTDAKTTTAVKTIAEFPAESYGKISYPVVILNEKPETKRFFDFLFTPKATDIFQQAGFKIPRENR